MIYTTLTRRAMKIAYNAHQNQFDRAGVPYIYHPIHLAEQMDTEIECVVALLHDVVEDTNVTLEELKKEFPKEVIENLKYLIHDKQVFYMDYIKEIKKHPIARKVKMIDLIHNMDKTRLDEITEEDRIREKKYEEAFLFLKSFE